MSILVLGDLILDEYWHGNSTRLSPEAPIPVVADVIRDVRPGGAANVALNLHSMGSDTKLISQAANDFNAALLGTLPHEIIPCKTTPRKLRIFANNQVICRIDDERFQGVTENLSWFTPDISICVLSDYDKGFLCNAASMIRTCSDLGIKTIVDPKKDWHHYVGSWLLKANDKELTQQIGYHFNISDLPAICSEISWEYSISNLVITLGGRGLYAWSPAGGMHLPAPEQQVIDVTGAGDVVIAALAHHIDQGSDLLEAADLANRLAALSVSKHGTYIVTPDDMDMIRGKVVFTNGCFDILHKGHLDYLRSSRQLGSKLIVGLNSDRSVRELKGPPRPINRQEDRKAMLESLEFVDEVIIFDEPTPRELILKVRPDIITKGGDYTVDQVVGNDLVRQVVIIPTIGGYSTSNIVEKLR